MPPRQTRSKPATPTAATGTTFARRHPILAAFGVLAGLSLFAAYFPVSAIVTAVVVGVHATGVDRLGVRAVRHVGSVVLQRWRARHAPPGAPSPGDASHPSPPGPPARGAPAMDVRGRAIGARAGSPMVRGVTPPRVTRRVSEPPVAAGVDREVEL